MVQKGLLSLHSVQVAVKFTHLQTSVSFDYYNTLIIESQVEFRWEVFDGWCPAEVSG